MKAIRAQGLGITPWLLATLASSALQAAAAGGNIQDGPVRYTLAPTYWGPAPAADLLGTEANPATDVVFQSGWWYRVEGDTREYPLPAPDGETFIAGQHKAFWTNLAGKNLRVVVQDSVFDHEGPSGGVWSSLFVENDGAERGVTLFHYLDYDGAGTSSNDTGERVTATYAELHKPGGPVMRYRALTPSIANTATGKLLLGLYPNLLTRLNDAVVDEFFPSSGPVGPGDVTAAYEFKATLGPDESVWAQVTFFENLPSRYVKGAGNDMTPFPSPTYQLQDAFYVMQLMRRAQILDDAWGLPQLGVPVGLDDFDGDYTSDVLYRDPLTGAVHVDLEPLSGAAAPPLNWVVAATGDFSFDGMADILWRNTTSQKLSVWFMNGARRIFALAPTPDQAADANWQAVGAPDVNADGNRDILWYNQTTGKLVIWYMTGTLVRVSGGFTDPPSVGNNNWRVVSVGDYGKGATGGALPAVWNSADVVWQNDASHKLVVWFMDTEGRRTSGTFMTPDTLPGGQDVVGPR